MSEEILKALMQFFAILGKQEEGNAENKRNYVHSFLMSQLSREMIQEYLDFYDKKAKVKKKKGEAREKKLTSVGDSVRVLGICKKINKTLTQKQKVVVLVRLFEFLKFDENFSAARLQIIETAANVFNIKEEEYNDICSFATADKEFTSESESFLKISGEEEEGISKYIYSSHLDSPILILKVPSVNIYFLRYFGDAATKLNNKPIASKEFYLFAEGSIITPTHDRPVYYSDIVSVYLSQEQDLKLSFVADNITYQFKNGDVGIQPLTIAEGAGKLIGLMGASGAGKSTLLNVLSGIEKPSSGTVRINGQDINKDKDLEGVVGFVPQDDLLIEELTVYQNLYFNAKLCFKNLSDKEVAKKVLAILDSLGLSKAKDLKVGNPLDKTISGGQRKRLNIGLELIREPSVLFLDEPTSGLSSKDSINVVDLLRQLALKGKLIFVVIHQPSSEIYKMFDKMIFLDQGGYLAYYGNPIEAVSYFKRIDNQVESNAGNCEVCGTVNSEMIFDILESRVVNEFGELTDKRKVEPHSWNQYYHEEFDEVQLDEVEEVPSKALFIPSRIKQWFLFLRRDTLSKLANTQYMLITFLEAPILAFILSFIVKKSSGQEEYIYADNENIPSYIFMSIVVSLFLGLTVSAEEIFRDQKILKRERFLNLSRNSYLLSKVSLLIVVSAVQSASFVLVGNTILEIQGMFMSYFSMLFTISVLANIIGLNISASFNSAVTIYIVIPILIIPQMILGGAMFSFNKLNESIGGGKGMDVPVVAEFIPARWAYEGLMVDQFMNNAYGKVFYDLDEKISVTNYKQAYLMPLLEEKVANLRFYLIAPSPSQKVKFEKDLRIIKSIIENENKHLKKIQFNHFEWLTPEGCTSESVSELESYLIELKSFYSTSFLFLATKKEIRKDNEHEGLDYTEFKNQYRNDYLEKILTNAFVSESYQEINDEIVQVKDPIYMEPLQANFMGVGAHFYSPHKYVRGVKLDTPTFNKLILVLMGVVGYITLYFNLLSRFFSKIQNVNVKRKKHEKK